MCFWHFDVWPPNGLQNWLRMIELIKSAALALQLYLMRRREFDNLKLRRHFKKYYGIDVGLYSYGCFDRWRMPGPMKVGRYCSVARTVRSARGNHPIGALTTHPVLYERTFGVIDTDISLNDVLVIEDDVWIGHNVVILPGCKHIGRGAVIGAGAIVTKDVASYSVMAGNPARKLRDRFPPDLIEAVEESRWWELNLAELRKLVKSKPDAVYTPSASSVREWVARQRQ
jgi:virginiamycin A acetyltransferase